MAFLVYFLVLVVMAGSVMFGLDWENAPLHGPAQQATTGMQAKSQHRPAAANASASTRRAQIATSVGRHQPKPVTEQQPQTASIAATPEQRPEAASTPQHKPEVVAQRVPPAAAPPIPPERTPAAPATEAKPDPAAQQQPNVADIAAPTGQIAETVPTPRPKPERVAHAPRATAPPDDPPERPRNGASTEGSAVGAAAETRKSQAKRNLANRGYAQARSSARAQLRHDEDGRQSEQNGEPRAPAWAIRGAEAARREAGREEHARAPSWAIRGAEAAAREADDMQVRETSRRSWDNEATRFFRWQ